MKLHRELTPAELAELTDRTALIGKRQATIAKVMRKLTDLLAIERKTLERIALLEKSSGEDEKHAEELNRRHTQIKLLGHSTEGARGELAHAYEQLRLAACGLRDCIREIGKGMVAFHSERVADLLRPLFHYRHVAIAKAQETDIISRLEFFFSQSRAPYAAPRSAWREEMILSASETQVREAQTLREGGDIFPDSVAVEDGKTD